MQRYLLMKKFNLFFLIICFVFPVSVVKAEKLSVALSSCVDGDTAKFILNDEIITARFLAIDTPETKHPTKKEEPWGKEASSFTCNSLTNASKIEIEYDSNSDSLDKYNRHLVWIWVDEQLLQEMIIKNGYGKVAYLYGDYQYTSLLQNYEKIAQENRFGIWGENPKKEINYWYIIFSILILVFIFLFGSTRTKRKIQNKIKQKIKKEIQRF